MINQEKADIISNILNSDPEYAKELLKLEPNMAAEQINAFGHSFSAEDISEYGELLKNSSSLQADGDELCIEIIDNIAGGLISGNITVDKKGNWSFNLNIK